MSLNFFQDIQERKQQLEEMEEKAVKAALIEERSRFCHFVSLLNPVVVKYLLSLFCAITKSLKSQFVALDFIRGQFYVGKPLFSMYGPAHPE